MSGKKSGQALVELALTIGLILMLFSFMFDVFAQIHTNMIAMAAVREGARWAARQKEPEEMFRWGLWKTCDSLQSQGITPEGFTCPSLESIMVTSSGGRVSGRGIEIVTGWVEDPSVMVSNLPGGYRFPYGHPLNWKAEFGVPVPLWVAVRLEKERPLGYIPLDEYRRYVVFQQNTVLTDMRH